MDSLPPIPAFVFAYVARKPRSLSELNELPAVERQTLAIKKWSHLTGGELGRVFLETTTDRKKAFVDCAKFQEAIKFATERKTELLVGGLFELLSRVPRDKYSKCVAYLDGLGLAVRDASNNSCWHNLGKSVRDAIEGMSIDRRRRGLAISAGLERRPAGSSTRGSATGVAANRRRALRTAMQIKPIVDEMKAELPGGAVLSPSALMHRLNDLGLKGPRSDKWSLNAAKRYLTILAGLTPAGDN